MLRKELCSVLAGSQNFRTEIFFVKKEKTNGELFIEGMEDKMQKRKTNMDEVFFDFSLQFEPILDVKNIYFFQGKLSNTLKRNT